LFDFSNSPQVYVEVHHVGTVANAKLSNVANVANVEASNAIHNEVGDDVVILFSLLGDVAKFTLYFTNI
jgi:hypothetical protein